jgi:ABC-2 type transport system permease protein
VIRAYTSYVRAAFAIALQYRVNIFGRAAGTLLWILILTRVWSAAYEGRPVVAGFTVQDTVVYLTLANLQAMVINSPLAWIIASRVRSGEVLFDVSRPIGYPGQMLALQTGESATLIAVIALVTPVAGLIGGLSGPDSAAAGLLYAVALLLGWLLNALLSLLVGLSAFWTVENSALATLYRFVAAFLAGATVPLAFFPPALRALTEVLPFRFIVYEPAAIYLGLIPARDALGSLTLALMWIAVLAGVIALVWRRAYRKMVVHGG